MPMGHMSLWPSALVSKSPWLRPWPGHLSGPGPGAGAHAWRLGPFGPGPKGPAHGPGPGPRPGPRPGPVPGPGPAQALPSPQTLIFLGKSVVFYGQGMGHWTGRRRGQSHGTGHRAGP